MSLETMSWVPQALPLLARHLLLALLLVGAARGDEIVTFYGPDASAVLQASHLASSKAIDWHHPPVDRRTGVKPRLCAIVQVPIAVRQLLHKHPSGPSMDPHKFCRRQHRRGFFPGR